MVILSPPEDRKEFFKQEAQKLREQAQEIRRAGDDEVEAGRLEDLADQAQNQAQGIDAQIREAAK